MFHVYLGCHSGQSFLRSPLTPWIIFLQNVFQTSALKHPKIIWTWKFEVKSIHVHSTFCYPHAPPSTNSTHIMHMHTTHTFPIFISFRFSSVSLSDKQFSRHGPILRSHVQMTLTCSRSKIPICIHILYIPPRTKFSSVFCSMMSWVFFFWVMAQYWQKCTEWPQNNLDMIMVKNTHMHTRDTPEAQIFVSFAVRVVLEL